MALFGTLAPDGAIIKRSAADPALFEREGRAVVFTSLEDLAARIDDPDLDVTPDDFLVLQNAGPRAAAMPEAGYLPIPAKLARAGVKDMVRISDARMSGTAYGTIVLHVSPEAAVGGPLALVRNGDRIRLSVRSAAWTCWSDDGELARRRGWTPRRPPPPRGYRQALHGPRAAGRDLGCDFDFKKKNKRHKKNEKPTGTEEGGRKNGGGAAGGGTPGAGDLTGVCQRPPRPGLLLGGRRGRGRWRPGGGFPRGE